MERKPPPPPVALTASAPQSSEEGLPSVEEIAKRAAPHAIAKLYEIGCSPDPRIPASTKVAALNSILDRALGKAAQNIKQEVNFNEVIDQIHKARGMVVDVDDGES